MNEQVWWFASRSSGIIAWILITMSIVWGISLSTRLTGQKPTPAWLLDLHRYLGGLSLVFTAVHLSGLALDSYVHFGWTDILIPWAASWKPQAVAWGVIAMYLMIAIQVTSLFMRKLPRKLWRYVHFSSWPLFVLATVHGLQAGTDVQNRFYEYVALASVQVVVFLTLIRAMAQRRARGKPRQAVPSA